MTLRKREKFSGFIINNNRKNVFLIKGEEIPWPPASKHQLPERKWKNPNLNKNLQLLQDPCSGPYQLILRGVFFIYQWNQLPLQIPFYRQNSFLFPCGFISLCGLLTIFQFGGAKGEKGKMQVSSSKCQEGSAKQLGSETQTQGGALLWLGRMWAQPHLVSFNAHSKGPELLHSFSMSYIKSDY